MRIEIKTIPYAEMRYPTVGDYLIDQTGARVIFVSDMGNPDYEFLIALHELVEAKLCEKRGISDESITAFDVQFETNRDRGDESEPGDDVKAPYSAEHCLATGIERIMCAALDIKWEDYETACREVAA